MSGKRLPLEWAGAGSANLPAGTENVDLRESQPTLTSACSEKLVDGKLSLHVSMSSNDKEPLHTGKWSEEEMAYAEGLIGEFKAGNLALPDGTSLRQFLAKMLNCSPKRISKRYEGNNYSKGRKFYVKSTEKMDPIEAQSRRKRLNDLERKYKQKLMHLKMPHLLLASRKADLPQQEEEPLKGDIKDKISTAAAITATNSSARVGLLGSVTDPAFRSANLHTLRMDPVLKPRVSTDTPLQLPNPRPTNAAVGLADTNTLSSGLAEDTGLALMTQASSQVRDSQRLSALLEAQRMLNNRVLRGSTLSTLGSLHQDLLGGSSFGSSSLLGDRASSLLGDLSSLSSNPSRQQSLSAALTQERLQQVVRAEQLRNAAQQSAALPFGTSLSRLQANAAAPLPSNSFAATHPLTLLAPPSTVVQHHFTSGPSDRLQSLLQVNTQSGEQLFSAAVSGQKRSRASESDALQDSITSRRRLDGPGNIKNGIGWNFGGRCL